MTFFDIVKLKQHELKQQLHAELRKHYDQSDIKFCRGFLYAEGDIPVMVVAHLDTVHRKPVETVCVSDDGRYVMSPQGIGGDDRCGVYIILQLLERYGIKPYVLFTEDEEVGGIGARMFTKSTFMPDLKYIIEFDRRGDNDAVFYDCDNPAFTAFVETFGFREEYGSFSDISYIAPHLKAAAVNLSSGYFNEHTLHEMVDLVAVEDIIKRGAKLVMAHDTVSAYEYIEHVYVPKHYSYRNQHNFTSTYAKGYAGGGLYPHDEEEDDKYEFYFQDDAPKKTLLETEVSYEMELRILCDDEYYLKDSEGHFYMPDYSHMGCVDSRGRFYVAMDVGATDFSEEYPVFIGTEFTVVSESLGTIMAVEANEDNIFGEIWSEADYEWEFGIPLDMAVELIA